jgi:hypothetical protein
VQEAAELVAIDVYQHAEKSGQPITLAMVERRLVELLAHAPGCRCRLCEARPHCRHQAPGGPLGVWALRVEEIDRLDPA